MAFTRVYRVGTDDYVTSTKGDVQLGDYIAFNRDGMDVSEGKVYRVDSVVEDEFGLGIMFEDDDGCEHHWDFPSADYTLLMPLGRAPSPDDFDVPVNQPMSEVYPKYYKDVSHLGEIDVYAVHQLFEIDDPSGALHHASKKLLLSGARTGGKSKRDDIKEARDTLTRWLDLTKDDE